MRPTFKELKAAHDARWRAYYDGRIAVENGTQATVPYRDPVLREQFEAGVKAELAYQEIRRKDSLKPLNL